MLVKICGITTLEDALAAVELGADMLGFNFYPKSKRYIDPAVCASIQADLQVLRREVIAVGVFVNATAEEIQAISRKCNLDYAQLSGDETPVYCGELQVPWIKGLRPRGEAEALAGSRAYASLPNPAGRNSDVPRLLVDAYHPHEYGGTGRTGDWSAARQLAKNIPILLAGGLNPENVAEAVRQVQPAGVDVASGVESRPGMKDKQKMARFIERSKNATVAKKLE